MGFIWTMVIGFLGGILANLVLPGARAPIGHELADLLMSALAGIGGASFATLLGQSAGWFAPGGGAGLMLALPGALLMAGLRQTSRTRRF